MLLEGYQATAEAIAPSAFHFSSYIYSKQVGKNEENIKYLKAVEKDAKFLTITFSLIGVNGNFSFSNASITCRGDTTLSSFSNVRTFSFPPRQTAFPVSQLFRAL